VTVRIVVPKGKSLVAKYAAEVTAAHPHAPRRNISGTSYPDEKADQLAIPKHRRLGRHGKVGLGPTIRALFWRIPKSIRRCRQVSMPPMRRTNGPPVVGDLVTTMVGTYMAQRSFATWMERKISTTGNRSGRPACRRGCMMRAEQETVRLRPQGPPGDSRRRYE